VKKAVQSSRSATVNDIYKALEGRKRSKTNIICFAAESAKETWLQPHQF
jgi:hypothetical protein